MGVPKFYRWLSERYPAINCVISDLTLLPEFDHLYLDMNGILHGCSYNSDDGRGRSERDCVLALFRYLDRLISGIVKPKRLLYLALDGVAPRAKMNQQRSRRFRSAKDRMEAVAKAKQSGDRFVDEADHFDSNCITPGTTFMIRMGEIIKFFVRKKLKEDPLWRHLTVVFSGADVAGEGEHKIMQFMRELKQHPSYDPNTRHCMYGSDADLIMLGLVSHEPHFTLLREVVDFNAYRRKNQSVVAAGLKKTQEAKFQMLHLSVLREYIAIELIHPIPNNAGLDLERVLDDFVFMTFLIGNDFLPHLPSLDIGEGAFDRLFEAYRQLLPTWGEGEYLTESGDIPHLERLEELIGIIGAQEADVLEKREEEEKKFRGRIRRHNPTGPTEEELELQNLVAQSEYEAAFAARLGEQALLLHQQSLGGKKDYKGRYYYEKMGLLPDDAPVLQRLLRSYVEGLLWCLAYYYRGCVSWSWFYPFHYGPFLSDLKGLKRYLPGSHRPKDLFELAGPLPPFLQLLCCLPPASQKLLPRCYGQLMTSPASPIKEFYPDDFQVDMNGKRNPWEGVNLLPFLDVSRAEAAVDRYCPSRLLTSEEQARNRFGHVYLFRFDVDELGAVRSPVSEVFGDVNMCQTSVRILTEHGDLVNFDKGYTFTPQLQPGVKLPYPGFPSIGVLPIEGAKLKAIRLNIFGTDSRYETLVLRLCSPPALPPAATLASKLLLKTVFVNWPMMHEAKIVAVSDETGEFRVHPADVRSALLVMEERRGKGKGPSRLKPPERSASAEGKVRVKHKQYDAGQTKRWQMESNSMQNTYFKGAESPGTGGLEIGQVSVRVRVIALQGMRSDAKTGAIRKVFGVSEADIPIQMCLWKNPAPDPRFIERRPRSPTERFPLGTPIILRGDKKPKLRGLKARVAGHDVSQDGDVLLALDVQLPQPEQPFGKAIADTIVDTYLPIKVICRAVGLPFNVFKTIISSFRVAGDSLPDPRGVDLGLQLMQRAYKGKGGFQLLGYVKGVVVAEDADHTANGGGEAGKAAWFDGDTLKVVGDLGGKEREEDDDEDEIEWMYTGKVAALVGEYQRRYPDVFESLGRMGRMRSYDVAEFLGGPECDAGRALALFEDISSWLKSLEINKLPRVPVGVEAMSIEAVAAVERAADVMVAAVAGAEPRVVRIRNVEPEDVLMDESLVLSGVGASSEKLNKWGPELGDRVLNINCAAVPFGLKGTVVAKYPKSGFVDVVFDEEFMGGTNLQGLCSNYRGLLVAWTSVLHVGVVGRKTLSSEAEQPPVGDAEGEAESSLRMRIPVEQEQDGEDESEAKQENGEVKAAAGAEELLAALGVSQLSAMEEETPQPSPSLDSKEADLLAKQLLQTLTMPKAETQEESSLGKTDTQGASLGKQLLQTLTAPKRAQAAPVAPPVPSAATPAAESAPAPQPPSQEAMLAKQLLQTLTKPKEASAVPEKAEPAAAAAASAGERASSVPAYGSLPVPPPVVAPEVAPAAAPVPLPAQNPAPKATPANAAEPRSGPQAAARAAPAAENGSSGGVQENKKPKSNATASATWPKPSGGFSLADQLLRALMNPKADPPAAAPPAAADEQANEAEKVPEATENSGKDEKAVADRKTEPATKDPTTEDASAQQPSSQAEAVAVEDTTRSNPKPVAPLASAGTSGGNGTASAQRDVFDPPRPTADTGGFLARKLLETLTKPKAAKAMEGAEADAGADAGAGAGAGAGADADASADACAVADVNKDAGGAADEDPREVSKIENGDALAKQLLQTLTAPRPAREQAPAGATTVSTEEANAAPASAAEGSQQPSKSSNKDGTPRPTSRPRGAQSVGREKIFIQAVAPDGTTGFRFPRTRKSVP